MTIDKAIDPIDKATADVCDQFDSTQLDSVQVDPTQLAPVQVDRMQLDPTQPDGQAALRNRLLEVAGLSEIFKVLGDETRTRIVYLLSLQELCVHDVAEVMEMSLPAVSHHLRLLKLMRLVKYRREGKHVFYSLDDEHILGLIQLAKEHYEEDR